MQVKGYHGVDDNWAKNTANQHKHLHCRLLHTRADLVLLSRTHIAILGVDEHVLVPGKINKIDEQIAW